MCHGSINYLKGIAIVLLTIVMPLSFLPSCGSDNKDLVEVAFDPQTSYTSKETGINALISDSGVTKYKAIAQTRLYFGKASKPFYYYPDGIYLEKFDTLFNIEAVIKADTAYYYESQKLWELKSNVDITNLDGERFETSQLFWEENKKVDCIYSDSSIRYTDATGDNIRTGSGFTSNENFTEVKIYDSGAKMTMDMRSNTSATDTIPSDSLGVGTIPKTDSPSKTDSIISENNNAFEIKEKK